jgi:hypothetical protein
MSTKPLSRAAIRRMKMNEATLEKVSLGEFAIGETHAFARILKCDGNGVMSVRLACGKEHKEGKATIRGGLRSGSRNAPTRMGVGDIVVVTLPDMSIAGTAKIHHIIVAVFPGGRYNREVVRMVKAGTIPEWMVRVTDEMDGKAARAEDEEGYEFAIDSDEEGDDGAAAGGAGAGGKEKEKKRGGGSKVKGAAEEEINIADI